ncbi:adenylate/guanylate cyclase domain-containing protein [Candidatus Woesearchaeota archaeon]|nr:adenylate/guanylate cyclase domain-containing protein [Candidatus Woesearchaeota archaeon]
MGWLFGNGVKGSWLNIRLSRISNISEALKKQLQNYCIIADIKELSSVNLLKLEKDWNVPRQELAKLFLHATKEKIFTMNYVMHCEKCPAQGTLPKLSQFKSKMVCTGCQASLTPKLDQSVEVAFSIHEDLAKSQKVQPGHYIPAIEIVNTEEFRTLFEAEKPLPGEHLVINQLTFFFTDLSGSTATYEKLGDGKAYGIVKEHFILLFEIIKKHNGAIVKTIGDAVMATFLSSADAVTAALEAKQAFVKFNKRKDIKGAANIKIGIHTGNCLAVTLNQRLDYFGNTVNKAARIQGAADKDEICISKDTLQEAQTRALFKDLKPRPKSIQLKGILQPVDILSIR